MTKRVQHFRPEERPGFPLLLWRGITKRCPRCGAGKLFRRWVQMRERCPGCGYRFEREEGFMLGVMTMNFGAAFVAFGVYLVAAFALTVPDPPLLLLTLLGAAIFAVFPFVFYPFAKTLWCAIDLAMRPLEVVEIAEAATYLAAQPRPLGGEGESDGHGEGKGQSG